MKMMHDIRNKCMSEKMFEQVCCKDEHYVMTLCRLFDTCGNNCYETPWNGTWLTSDQAYRLIKRIYSYVPNIMTPVTTVILQFVLDVLNIPHVFGENSVYACSYGVLPLPRFRLNADDFLNLL